MSGIFATAGVTYSATDNAVEVTAIGGTPLYYPTNQCNPRFDPRQANGVISEIANVSIKAGLSYNCGNLDNLSTAICALIDARIVDAFCNPTAATADQITTICGNLAGYNFITCINGEVVGVPLSKLTDDGGGNNGGDCPADSDTVVRPIGTTFVNAWGDFDVGGTCTSVPQITPASQGWGGTWSITSSVPGNSGLDECGSNSTDTWTKSAC